MNNISEFVDTRPSRDKYIDALSVIQELILLGERHIPSGPRNAYSILDWITGHVNSLELEIIKMRAGMQRLSCALEEQMAVNAAKPILGAKCADTNIYPSCREALNNEMRKADAAKLEELKCAQEQAAQVPRLFPKVTL